MEILKELCATQEALEDALRLEITPETVKETKDGKRLLKYLRRRRRIVNQILNIMVVKLK